MKTSLIYNKNQLTPKIHFKTQVGRKFMFSKIKNQTLKSVSLLLSITTIFSVAVPSTFAEGKPKANQKTIIVASSKRKKQKAHTKNKKTVYVGMVAAGVIGTGLILRHLIREWNLSKIVTAIDGLTPHEIDENIEEEIRIYKNRASDVFEFDYNLMQIDHKILLLTLMRINYLFDKYEEFTENLIRSKRNDKEEFCKFKLMLDKYGSKLSYDTIACTQLGYGITFNKKLNNNFKNRLSDELNDLRNNWHAPCDKHQLIEYTITHEFGHVIHRLYECENHMWRDSLVPEVFGSHAKDFISRYGAKSLGEFFAEVFANLECNNAENVHYLGKKLEKFLVNKACYLPKENSKFNKY